MLILSSRHKMKKGFETRFCILYFKEIQLFGTCQLLHYNHKNICFTKFALNCFQVIQNLGTRTVLRNFVEMEGSQTVTFVAAT